MRNLPEPDRAGARDTLVKALSQYKHRGTLRGYSGTKEEIDQVVAIYDAYDAGRGVAAAALTAPLLSETLKSAVHDAYDQTQKNRRLKDVRNQIFRGVELCPVCGIDPPTEADHVLPRSEYLALAIYVRNLVPLCHLCNHRKLAGFAEPGELGFVHAYFDVLPDVQFLEVDINLDGATLAVDFSISEADPLLGDFGLRLSNIHTKLKLTDRYRSEVNLYLVSQAIALHGAFRASGIDGVRAHLRAQAYYEAKCFYRNHWRPTLLYALAENDEFCNGGFAPVFAVPHEALEDALS